MRVDAFESRNAKNPLRDILPYGCRRGHLVGGIRTASRARAPSGRTRNGLMSMASASANRGGGATRASKSAGG